MSDAQMTTLTTLEKEDSHKVWWSIMAAFLVMVSVFLVINPPWFFINLAFVIYLTVRLTIIGYNFVPYSKLKPTEAPV